MDFGGQTHMQAQPPPFDRLIKTLDGFIAEVAASNLCETVALLQIARIDLVARAKGISEDDLDAVLFAVESELRVTDYIDPRGLKKRRRKVANLAGHG
jgi:hypothetical protein